MAELPRRIEPVFAALPPTVAWHGGEDGVLLLLDQTRLPREVTQRRCENAEQVWQAIRELCVRGAPAIGVAAAYGLCLGVKPRGAEPVADWCARVQEVAAYLNSSRPTAVNLSWALKRMTRCALAGGGDTAAARFTRLLSEAHAVAREDAETCRRIGEHGARLIPEGGTVLTHCNAGALATVAYGTALSLMYVAREQGRNFRVFADETRPLLQGGRLTAFELAAAGIDTTVICDGAAASVMAAGKIDLVVVGADRIAANGDTANKIGTYGLAIAARHHGVPFFVAAPRSTFDLSLASGSQIPIEFRSGEEISGGPLGWSSGSGAGCLNPAFDVTPAGLIAGIVTESGVVEPVTEENIRMKF